MSDKIPSRTILLVEDNETLMPLLNKMLMNSGYAVICAQNGHEAMERYDPNLIDLVLTDLVMPEKEGFELMGELRRINSKVRIIAMSGDGAGPSTSYLQMAKMLGANAVLTKPFSSDELLAAIATALDSSHS